MWLPVIIGIATWRAIMGGLVNEERLKRALDVLVAEPSKRPGAGSGTILVAYRMRDRPTLPSLTPCHVLMTAYDAEHPMRLLIGHSPKPDDIMVYAFLGRRRLDRVLMAMAPSSSSFFHVLADNLCQDQPDTGEVTEAGQVDPEVPEDICAVMEEAYAERRGGWELIIGSVASSMR